MKETLNKEVLFPVDKNEQESMQQLAEKLEELNAQKTAAPTAKETISDDFDVDAERLKTIEKCEAEMRELLQMMNINYDDLIRMDGKSVYSRAVSANPAVLQHVKNAQNPVLEAVKISLQFKPYAEFMEKYGQEPDEIFQNIKQEIADQNDKGQQKTATPSVTEIIEGSSFSGTPSIQKQTSKKQDIQTLADIFNK